MLSIKTLGIKKLKLIIKLIKSEAFSEKNKNPNLLQHRSSCWVSTNWIPRNKSYVKKKIIKSFSKVHQIRDKNIYIFSTECNHWHVCWRVYCLFIEHKWLCVFCQEAGLQPNTHVYSALIGRASRRLDYAYLKTLLKSMRDKGVWPNQVIIKQLEFAAQYPPNFDKVTVTTTDSLPWRRRH